MKNMHNNKVKYRRFNDLKCRIKLGLIMSKIVENWLKIESRNWSLFWSISNFVCVSLVQFCLVEVNFSSLIFIDSCGSLFRILTQVYRNFEKNAKEIGGKLPWN